MVLVAGQLMAGVFGILYAFAYTRERYWSYTFPAMVLATAGSSVTYLVSKYVFPQTFDVLSSILIPLYLQCRRHHLRPGRQSRCRGRRLQRSPASRLSRQRRHRHHHPRRDDEDGPPDTERVVPWCEQRDLVDRGDWVCGGDRECNILQAEEELVRGRWWRGYGDAEVAGSG